MVKIGELRKNAARRLADSGCDSPRADADFLLTGLFGLTKTELILGEGTLDACDEEKFEECIGRAEKGEPVQYIVGKCEFMSLEFKVNSATLIPRCDTEILTEDVIRECKRRGARNVLEIGCGSGCIAVSIAHCVPDVRVFAADISDSALAIAAENSRLNGTEGQTVFFKHDIMKGFPPQPAELPDIIVSNPPYIPTRDISELDVKVSHFEPRTALDGGADGLDFYRKITECARLTPHGLLAFEVGFGQAAQVAEIMKSRFESIETVRDLSGIERVVKGTLRRTGD